MQLTIQFWLNAFQVRSSLIIFASNYKVQWYATIIKLKYENSI